MFYDKYIVLCNKKGVSPSGAALEIGISKPSVNRWKNGGGATDATIKRVADYFGVDVDYFTKDEEKPSVQEDEGLNEVQKAAWDYIQTLSDEQLKRFIAMGKAAFEKGDKA